ncbi:MAG: potassium-transporting ATPase subunit C, partial [Asticcacaulis sp.]|nr:potassium-transporting ATPase subunit C [Asticcacaulis sp.]
MKTLVSSLRPAIVSTLLLTLLLGGVYPALTTAILKIGFPHQAGG